MTNALKPRAQTVQSALHTLGFTNTVIELSDSTRSAAEAADAVGCTVGQIAKSLLFRGKESGQAVLIIASGPNRVDEAQMAAVIGEELTKPNAAFVRERTGFAIGGVPPIGHLQPLRTYIDETLLNYDEIWAAAGHPHAVFRLTPAELIEMTHGIVMAVC